MIRGLAVPKLAYGASRQLKGRKAALVLVAVEKRGRNMTGRARMEVIPDFKSETLTAFLKDNARLRTASKTFRAI